MNTREKTAKNRNKASVLKEAWHVDADHVRYRENGTWYHPLERFPGALFDRTGYVRFPTKEAFPTKHICPGGDYTFPKGISTLPGYVRCDASQSTPRIDVDIHDFTATEGNRRLVLHLQRERNQTVVRKKKKYAASLDCEVCGFSFGRAYGSAASEYCEVHHLLPLSDIEHSTQTRIEDLAILCANCHRVVHLHNPPHTLNQVRRMLAK